MICPNAPSFGTAADSQTLSNPTRARGDNNDYSPTAESVAWPEQADILALVKVGIPYDDALDMSPIECERTLAIAAAWAIPAKKRVGGTVMATTQMLDRKFGC